MATWKSPGSAMNKNNYNSPNPSMVGQQQQQQQQQQYYHQQQQQQQQQQNYQHQEASNGPRAKCDQVVFEAIAKAAEVVVGSRCYIDNSSNRFANSGSSRFNLLVPEVQGVRNILQRWKRALHVPLRLDVYYQHEDQRRELLERWCLEYAPSQHQNHHHQQQQPFHTQQHKQMDSDPIVQLRQVCKKVIIWLRTLYCWSRMLPSQALRGTTIGFSIYVVSEGNDDVSSLIANQGFLSQGQPSSVATPYGELGWKVFYAPKAMIARLIPTIKGGPYNKTRARPIPTTSSTTPPTQDRTKERNNGNNNNNHNGTISPTFPTVQSAPTNQRHSYQRSHSVNEAASRSPLLAPKRLTPRSNSGLGAPLMRNLLAPVSTVNNSNNNNDDPSQNNTNQNDSGGPPPSRALSGLSLAMMGEDENNNNNNNNHDNSNDKPESKQDTEQAEKRRAALHHAPPHFINNDTAIATSASPSTTPTSRIFLTSAGEYGYGYNNQIPWQQLRNHNNSTRMSPHDAHTERSPSPHHGTPPGYLGGTPPKPSFLGGMATPPHVNAMGLIPPRSSVAPPFVRPLGFAEEAPNEPNEPTAPTQPHNNNHNNDHNFNFHGSAPSGTNNTDNMAPSTMTSLDLLHSSPFQHPPQQYTAGSLLSSFSVQDPTFGAAATSYLSGVHADHYLHNPLGGHHQSHFSHHDDPYHHDDQDDMPFALTDTIQDSTAGSTGASAASGAATSTLSHLDSSAAVASFAQRCAAANRLSLFDSINTQQVQDPQKDMVSSLADQLAEFKTFGASLMMDHNNNNNGGSLVNNRDSSTTTDAGGSTSTPISLKS